MGQDELELPDLPEGKDKEQGGGAPVQSRVAGAGHGLARGEASSEQEGDSGAGDAGSYAAAGLGNDEEEDAKEALTEELENVAPPAGDSGRGDAPESGRNEHIYFERQGFRPARPAIAHATPPSSYRRLPFRSRKQYYPTRFIVAGDTASSIANAHDPGTGSRTSEAASGPQPTASLGSPSGTSRSAGDSAATNAGHGGKSEAMVLTAGRSERQGFRPARPAIAHATPPSSYRRLPFRSRKQYYPTRFIAAGDTASSIANAHDPGTGTRTSEAASGPQPTASLGSPSGTSRSAGDSAATNAGHGGKSEAMVLTAGRSEIDVAVDESCSDDHNTESKDVGAARVVDKQALPEAEQSSSAPRDRGARIRRPNPRVLGPDWV
ncbi:hypothetical protein Zm00014a_002579 [Zea mays]|uniref:Uncharacterized protein n=3 Tax=Zea mays TaxID=4577 RepID=A0A1D6MM19_MAIZE|nr:uncharacterized protein LOC100382381 [Zea mays]ONM30257.1 hypothetical protein ZEAMMB73_Zm00001d039983 [Zea mays]PWZ32382.1 hypothetical protein Zm00014a_002579 [Zea mays]|eukprot:NP_001308348.1 uncharacterized protein LOC100382381 [Zea mays]